MALINYHKTFLMNLIFLAILPLLIASFAPSEFFTIPFVILWSFFEMYIDYRSYKPHHYNFFKALFVTLGFNFLIIFGASLILVNIMPVLKIGRLSATGIYLLTLTIYVLIVSKLEELTDYSIYKN